MANMPHDDAETAMILLRTSAHSAGGIPVTEDASGTQAPDDATLLNMVRASDTDAFAMLYQRHEQAARRLARDLVVSPAEVDDVVAETFARVLDVTERGGGPTDAFRPYVLTALRRVCYDRLRGQRAQIPSDVRKMPDPGEPFIDPAVATLDNSLIARAYMSLPERWSAVLWHTEIEAESPADVAPLFGLTRNGVAALRRRAMEGLRQAYLQMHISTVARLDCKPVAERLGAYVRDALSVRDTSMVTEHLSRCENCTAVCAELADVSVALRSTVAPLVLGGAAATYLAAIEPVDEPRAETGLAILGGQAAGALGTESTVAADRARRQSAARRLRRGSQPLRWLVGGAAAVVAVSAIAFMVDLTAQRTPASPANHHHLAVGPASPSITAPTQPSNSSMAKSPSPKPAHHASTSPATPPAPVVATPTHTGAPPPSSVKLSASIDVYAGHGDGQGGVVAFQVTDTGSAATGELTVSISLPSGASMITGGGDNAHAADKGGWNCQPDSAGASCTRGGISAGARSSGTIIISVNSGSAACGRPVQITATSGGASASAQSPENIRC